VSDPVAILDLSAAVMLAVAIYCALRVVLVRRMHRTLHYDVNIAHVLMGMAMAGMLAPSLKVLPNEAWETVFSVLAAWFAWRSVAFVARHGLTGRSSDRVYGVSHYLTHLVMSCSMLYMYLAGVPASADRVVGMTMGPAPGTSDYVALPLFFIVVLCASAVWHVDALGRFTPAQVALASGGGAAPGVVAGVGNAEGRWLSPRLEMGCHIAMCAAMAFMLALLL
jgi:Domain of unknown function (DUF5134)